MTEDAQAWPGKHLSGERIEEIRAEIKRMDANSGIHGCDGCGCACCGFAQELLDHADWIEAWGGI